MTQFKLGQIVRHRVLFGRLVVVGKITIDNLNGTIEIMYRCRCQDTRFQDFFDFELIEEVLYGHR